MSLVGGFFSIHGAMDWRAIQSVVREFPILLGEHGQEYQIPFHPGLRGGIFAKYKEAQPAQVYSWQNENCVVITLGFHDMDYPQSFSAAEDIHTLIPKIQNSEGEFVSVLMDRRDGRIAIINNRFGTRVMYIAQTPEGIFFCSNLSLLARLVPVRLEPDELGILQFFCYQHTLTPRTHLKSVERLYPGSCVLLDGEGMHQRQYWSLCHQPDESLDPAEHAHQTIEALRRGLVKKVRRVPEGFCTLSGGLDSRMVAAVARRECDYFGFTYSNNTDNPDTPDVLTARRIAAALGMRHRTGQVPRSEVSAAADQVVYLTGGLVPIHHLVKTWQSIKMLMETTRFMIGGGCGDPIAGDYVNSIYQIEPVWTQTLLRLYAAQRKLVLRDTLCRLLRRDMVESIYPRVDASMMDSFHRLSGPTAAHTITAWAEVQYVTGFTFSSPIHNHPDISEASPALGYEYVDHMLRLPARWLYKKTFYKYMIYHQFPELRDIEYANTGERLSGKIETYRLSGKKRIVRVLARTLPFGILERIWGRWPAPGPSALGPFAGDDALFDRVSRMVSDVPALRQIFNPDACRTFIDNFRNGRRTYEALTVEDEIFGTIVSLAYWFQSISR